MGGRPHIGMSGRCIRADHPVLCRGDHLAGWAGSAPYRRECAPGVPYPMLKRRASGGSACQRANAAKAGSNAAALISGRAAECGACTVRAVTIARCRV